ncbi:MAG: hypothetical protein AMDU3_IPLC00004G0005 [Thermoplasmatales archaeon I-plasma]|jgi:hypothetical protein|nr:MAG: hypothetical protein AMDU3_IPLC00004G0005 [Thermoplasmatales archaeon I-plasma]
MNVGVSMVLRICGSVIVTIIVLCIGVGVGGSSSWTGTVFNIAEIALAAGTIMFTVKTANEALIWSIKRRVQMKAERV